MNLDNALVVEVVLAKWEISALAEESFTITKPLALTVETLFQVPEAQLADFVII
jgi:hypothetical protein